MGKPLYPEAQAEANKTAAYKGGEISALQGTQVVIFKARLQRGKWQWSATKSTAAGTVERQEEHRARWREEQSRNPNEYLARKNAEYNTTFTSRWLLHRHLYPDYPSRGSREERLLVLKQPVWSELVAASATGALSDDDIAQSVCGIIGVRRLALPDKTSQWERTTHAGLLALMSIKNITCSPTGALSSPVPQRPPALLDHTT